MPWPEPLVELLARPGSQASQALRWGLHGLRAFLQAALEEVPQDAGRSQLCGLLAELDPLLDQGGTGPALALTPDTSADLIPGQAVETSSHSPGLLALATAVAQDERLQAALRGWPIPDGSDDQTWSSVQLLLLRVSTQLAEEWRQRSQEIAEQAGGRLDEWGAAVLPLPWDQSIYPGVTGTIRAAGLRSDPSAALDPRVAPPVENELRPLAAIVSACLWFIEHDPSLYHCLKSVFRFGLSPLTGEQRERYTAELLRLWERLRMDSAEAQDWTPRQRSKERLKALVALDEALHSLVHQPPAVADSWWGRLMGQARQVLFLARERANQAGLAVHLQDLGGPFADINQLAPDSLQVDFGVPGEVAVCLRVWARIDGEELKGRVLYRSPQENL
jgi:hypothetical protein